jgi:hypothetical protein
MSEDWGSIRQEAAQVLLAEGTAFEGSLHLLLRLQYPAGPETPLEMLNRADPFFALTGATNGVVFVPKAQTAVVTCPHQAPADPERLSAAKLIALHVTVVGGREFQGRAAIELPPGRSRALDYVNGPGTFFALWNDEVTHYINKLLVRTIRTLD